MFECPFPFGVLLHRWQTKAGWIYLHLSTYKRAPSGSGRKVTTSRLADFQFRAYAPDVMAPADIKLQSWANVGSGLWFPSGQRSPTRLLMPEDADHPRIDPSLVTWGNGGNRAALLRFIGSVGVRFDFTLSVNLPT
jgi:hypothetical protein